jgi:hypothetical protein
MQKTKIQTNTDNNLQWRYLININSITVKIEQNPLFIDYVKTRMKKPIDTQYIAPFSYIRVEHGYFMPSHSDKTVSSFQLRESFDDEDLHETLKQIRKGTT